MHNAVHLTLWEECLPVAPSGCFGGFCPPVFGAPFEFKPFLSSQGLQVDWIVPQDVPGLVTGIAPLLLLFIVVCNTGCFNMQWEQGSSGGGQWGIRTLIIIWIKTSITCSILQIAVICTIRTIAPRVFKVDRSHSRPTLIRGPDLTPILVANPDCDDRVVCTLIPLSIIPQRLELHSPS